MKKTMTDAWKIWCGFVSVLFALCASQQAFAATITGKVTRVSDGDTVWVTDAAKVKHKVRLDRIDAPEKDQPWGKESAAVLKGWIFCKDVRVEYEKRDRYGRILGIVFNGTNDVNLAMVRSGNACITAISTRRPHMRQPKRKPERHGADSGRRRIPSTRTNGVERIASERGLV